MDQPTLSIRNRLSLRLFEVRASLRMGLARLDWGGMTDTILAAVAASGGYAPPIPPAERAGRAETPAR